MDNSINVSVKMNTPSCIHIAHDIITWGRCVYMHPKHTKEPQSAGFPSIANYWRVTSTCRELTLYLWVSPSPPKKQQSSHSQPQRPRLLNHQAWPFLTLGRVPSLGCWSDSSHCFGGDWSLATIRHSLLLSGTPHSGTPRPLQSSLWRPEVLL